MQKGQCRLTINQLGSDVLKFDVTPAEVMVLRKGFTDLVGKDPISKLELTGEVDRTGAEEIQRLYANYGNLRVKQGDKDVQVVAILFGSGDNPMASNVPETFDKIGPEPPKSENPGPQDYTPADPSNPVPKEQRKLVRKG